MRSEGIQSIELDRTEQALDRNNADAAYAILQEMIAASEPNVQKLARAEYIAGQIAENAVRWQDAYTHYKRAYHLDEGNIEALKSYARLTWRLHKGAEGIPLYEGLRDWARAEYGSESTEYATQLNNLAELYRAQGRLSEAEPLYDEALAVRRAALPEGHPHIATGLNNLAVLYQAQGRLIEAEPLCDEALAIDRAALPKGHPDIASDLNNLAELYREQGRLSEAEPLYDEALAIRRAALPEGHPDIAQSLNNLGVLRYYQRRFEDAVPLLREALEIYEKALPAGHPHTEGTRQSLEAVYELHPHLRDSSD